MIRSRSTITINGQEIVSITTQSLMDQQNHGDKLRSIFDIAGSLALKGAGHTAGIDIAGSLMPRGVALNAPVTQYLVTGLDADYINAIQENQKKRLRQAVPTADYVTRTSFKIGTRMLIKIEPTNAKMKERLRDYIPNLVFDKFSLQAISEPDSERYQLHETFEDEVLFLFGRRPRVWTMQGIVVNGRRAPDRPESAAPRRAGESAADFLQRQDPFEKENEKKRLKKDMDWANHLIQDWEDFYRGSKAIELQARTYLTYEDSVIEATLLELTVVRNAQVPSSVNAMITFVVHQRAFLGQEYRDGFTAANLRDLIDKTNAGKSFDEKEWAPEIKPLPASMEELKRQKVEAEGVLQQTQQDVIAAATEKAAVDEAMSEGEKEYAQAQKEYTEKTSEVARVRAMADAATNPNAKERLQQRADKIYLEAEEAMNKAHEAQQRGLAAEAQKTTTEANLDAATTAEADAAQTDDVLNQAIKNAGATVEPTVYTEEAVIQRLENELDVINVSDVTFKKTNQGIFVEFTAEYDDPDIGSGQTHVTVLM